MPGDWPGRVLREVLDAAEDAAPVDAVAAVTGRLADVLGATGVSFSMTDFTGRALVRLAQGPTKRRGNASLSGVDGFLQASGTADDLVSEPLGDGAAGVALRTQTLQVHPAGDGTADWRVLAPVTERGEVVGLLELTLPREPDPQTLDEVRVTAHALAFVVIANRRHTDLFEWSQRSTPFTLSAEIQRRLLPAASTCEAASFSLAGWLEPAASVGGDTFDYSLGRDVLHLSLTDAMGHGVAAALTATLCVNALRLSRRGGLDLQQQVTAANSALLDHATAGSGATGDGFVTGIVGRLDLNTGLLSLTNAGHVAPLLVRGGEVRSVELPVDLPMGMFPDAGYRRTTVQLEPGDRLVLLTDGMLERNAEALDLDDEVRRATPLHVREAVRALADAVLAQTGDDLEDDATILLLDWFGDHGSARSTSAGADPDRASRRRDARL